MAAQDIVDAMVIRGGGVLCLRPFTPDTGLVTGAGTDLNFAAVVDTEIIIVIDNAAAAQEFISIQLDHGVTVEFVKKAVTVDGADGTLKAAAGGGALDQINCTVAESDLSIMQSIMGLRNKRLRASVPLGEAAGSVNANTGWGHLCSQLGGNVSRKTQYETVVAPQLSFNGLQITADTAGDSAIAAAGGSITPLEGSALSVPAITDMTTFKKGQLVLE